MSPINALSLLALWATAASPRVRPTPMLRNELPRALPKHPPVAKPQPKPNYGVILYEDDEFHGRTVGLTGNNLNLLTVHFNDTVSSFKVRRGLRATFYENIDGKGLWFTYNCPTDPIGVRDGDYCELKHVRTDIATGHLCELREGARGCVPWWNDQISGVGGIAPADESQPQGRIDWGENP